MFKSYDDGDTWTAMFNGFATSQMYHMRGTVLHSDYFIAGLQDNGVKTRDYDGTFWLHKHGGDGFDVSFFPTTTDKYFTTINNRLYRFDDTLANITPNQDENGQYQWFGTVVTHYTNPDILFAGYTEIWRSTDRGETWTDIGGEGSWAMAACQSNHNRFYAAGSNDGFDVDSTGVRMYRLDNLGDDLDLLHYKIGFPSNIPKITDIAASPANADHVYFTVGGFKAGKKVYRSTQAGELWDNWSGSLPNIPINSIAVTGDGTGVYIGTDIGVF